MVNVTIRVRKTISQANLADKLYSVCVDLYTIKFCRQLIVNIGNKKVSVQFL